MTPNEILGVAYKRKVTFIVCFSLVCLSAVCIVKFSPKTYEATSWLLFESGGGTPSSDVEHPALDATAREQALRSEMYIAQSDEVIKKAAAASKVESMLAQREPSIFRSDTPPDRQVIIFLKKRISISNEPNSNLIRLSFRDVDPSFSEKFVNSLTTAFRERHIEIHSGAGTPDFFKNQESHYEFALKQAANELAIYQKSNALFSVKEERPLALETRETIAKELAMTQGAIVKQEDEINSLRNQITALRGRMTLPSEIFGTVRPSVESGSRSTAELPNASAEPPLLYVRIFQDSAQKFVSINAELAGLKALERRQSAELAKANQRLQNISSLESEFSVRLRKVSLIEAAIESLGRKRAEAEVDTSWRASDRLSKLQVVQPALQPIQPIFPKASIIMPISIVAGIFVSLAIVIMLEFLPTALAPRRTV